jgi:hypothetical protein
MRVPASSTLLILGAAMASPATGPAAALAPTELVFNSITPCRIIDTRCTGIPGNLCTPHQLVHGPTNLYSFQVHGPATDYRAQGGSAGGCGIPDAVANHNVAKAIAVNIVAAGATAAGNLNAWPADQPQPNASVINFSALASNGGLNIANGIILPICDDLTNPGCAQGDITVHAGSADAFLVADVTGYFTAESTDITGVNAGTGLTGGGTSGNLTLSLLAAYQLPQGCTSTQVPSWNGSTWSCATVGGGGTVTSITAGSGLTGGTITTSGTIAANFGGGGVATTLSRSDHNHLGQAWTGGGAAIGLRVATTDAASVGLQGETSSATGAGVVAKGSGAGGVALQVQNGSLQVQNSGSLQVLGAGLGTGTAAFIHQANGGNTFADATLLDYGALNDNPDLLLFVTPNGGKSGCVEDGHAFGLRFVPRSGAIPGHWWIYRADGNGPANNACYNVLVVKP